jgi:hypothetical protein
LIAALAVAPIATAADPWSWLAFIAAVATLGWATFRLLGHGHLSHLLLRICISLILLLGAGAVAVFTLVRDRPGLALALAFPVWVAAMILAGWLQRLRRGDVYEPDNPFSDLLVSWDAYLIALLLIIYKLT